MIQLKSGSEPLPGYLLIDKLGKGGFGEVWKATAPGGFTIALKFVMLDATVGHVEMRALEIIKHVHHPNLLATFGAWQTEGYLVIAMELADNTLLDRFKSAVGQGLSGIPRDELISCFLDAARGIDYLNEPRHPSGNDEPLGIQHRDIKPQNLLLVGGGVKVADFGLARVLEHTVTGHSGSMTPAYAAPEFFRGETTSQSDQYSLAVTYCHLRGGRLPFTGNPAEVMRAHLEQSPDLSMLLEVERPIVARALEKEPQKRWPSCRDFVIALSKTDPRNDIASIRIQSTVDLPAPKNSQAEQASTLGNPSQVDVSPASESNVRENSDECDNYQVGKSAGSRYGLRGFVIAGLLGCSVGGVVSYWELGSWLISGSELLMFFVGIILNAIFILVALLLLAIASVNARWISGITSLAILILVVLAYVLVASFCSSDDRLLGLSQENWHALSFAVTSAIVPFLMHFSAVDSDRRWVRDMAWSFGLAAVFYWGTIPSLWLGPYFSQRNYDGAKSLFLSMIPEIENYRTEHGSYPKDLEWLLARREKLKGVAETYHLSYQSHHESFTLTMHDPRTLLGVERIYGDDDIQKSLEGIIKGFENFRRGFEEQKSE